MLWSTLISLGILIATIISLVHKKKASKFKISTTLLGVYETPGQGFYAKLQVDNKSANQLSITGLNIGGVQYNESGKIAIENTEINPPVYNQEFPLDIGSYNAQKFCVHFRTHKRLWDFNKKVRLIVYTSRGTDKTKVNLESVQKPLDKIWY